MNKTTWATIAWLLTLVNAVGVWFAAREAQPWHAALHGVLAVAFALWAQRLWARR